MEDVVLNLVAQYPWLTIPVLIICVIGYIWAQVRPHITPERLEKLPDWLVWCLEQAAGNRGWAENLLAPKPKAKQIK